MVMSMMGGPPQGTALNGRVAHAGEDKLPHSIGLECFMREIPVVKTGYGKHADDVEGQRYDDRGPAPAHQNDAQATEMENYERCDPQPIHLFLVGLELGVSTGLSVEPAHEGDENPRFYKTFIDTIHLKQTTSFVVPIDINMN